MTDTPEPSRRDHMITTTEDGKIELTEQELNRVTGGAGDLPTESLSLNFTKVVW